MNDATEEDGDKSDKKNEKSESQMWTQRRSKSKSILCRFFQRGRCKLGGKCRYSHKLAHTMESSCDGKEAGATERTNTNTNTNITPRTNRENTSKSQCIYYQLGNCMNGEQCRFSHMKPETSLKREIIGKKAAAVEENVGSEKNEPTEETKKNMVPCRYHMQRRCTRGESCRFSHPKAESLLKINLLKENFAQAFGEMEEELEDATKNPNKGMQMIQLKKLHSLKKDIYSGLRNITQRVKTTNLLL